MLGNRMIDISLVNTYARNLVLDTNLFVVNDADSKQDSR